MRILSAGRLLPLMILLGLGGCAVQPHNHLDVPAKEQLGSTDTWLLIEQDELNTDIEQSNMTAAAGGGALFAIVDAVVENHRAKNAEELAKPIRDNLIEFDARGKLSQAIEAELAAASWLNKKGFALETQLDPKRLPGHYEASSADGVLLLVETYKLSADFSSLVVTLDAVMLPKSEALMAHREKATKEAFDPRKPGNNIYRNSFVVTKSLGTTGLDKDKAATTLADANSDVVRVALEQAASEIARMLSQDLAQTDEG